MKECKYRLPCDWCDKFDKKCEEVDYYELQNPNTCEHNWKLLDEWFDYDNKYVLQRYLCKKCGETEFRADNGSRQKQKECEHDWKYSESRRHTGGTDVYYKCSKCGATKMKYYDVVETMQYEYESGEWQP